MRSCVFALIVVGGVLAAGASRPAAAAPAINAAGPGMGWAKATIAVQPVHWWRGRFYRYRWGGRYYVRRAWRGRGWVYY